MKLLLAKILERETSTPCARGRTDRRERRSSFQRVVTSGQALTARRFFRAHISASACSRTVGNGLAETQHATRKQRSLTRLAPSNNTQSVSAPSRVDGEGKGLPTVHITRAAPAALFLSTIAMSAEATPNMIRLGYPTCASCHLSPQGGGLLTEYGKGIDAAQTLRPEELKSSEIPGSYKRLPYDLKFSLGVDRDPPAAAGYSFSSSIRTAFALSQDQYIVYGLSVGSPTLARANTKTGAVSARMSRLYWMYQPRDGVSLTVGRDDLPSGIGSGGLSFARSTTSPNVSSTPTQAKIFLWNKRWQIAAYGFGPDGNETAPRFEARGGGAVVGANVWKDRLVVGATTRASYADAYDRKNAGLFLRLGLTEHWGVLLEHDVTARTTDQGEHLTHVAGHSEIFFVPFDWLQTSIAAQDLVTINGGHTYRFTPSASVRLNKNLAVSFNTRDIYTGIASQRSRTYSVQVSVKTVE
jgi:hypothetical protein